MKELGNLIRMHEKESYYVLFNTRSLDKVIMA